MACTNPELPSGFQQQERRAAWLRQRLALIERDPGATEKDSPLLKFGIAEIDAALSGGLACGALHEIAIEREGEISLAMAFILLSVNFFINNLRMSFSQTDPPGISKQAMFWISENLCLYENGALHGPGLDQAGIAPERLITVAVPRARDVLWAMEETLRSRTVAVAIGELRARVIDHLATRRLSLAAAAGGSLGFLLRTTGDNEPSAATTRWIIGAAPPSPSFPQGSHGIGPPRLSVRLVRNRRGHLGAWIVEWNSVEQRFELAMHSEPMAGAALNRPHRAAVA
jgi:protein ImuA